MMSPAGERQRFLGKAPFAFDEGPPAATARHRTSKITHAQEGFTVSFDLDRGVVGQAYLR